MSPDRIKSYPQRQTSVYWHEPVHEALRGRLDIVKKAGGETSLSELAAAFIVFSWIDPEVLLETLRQFRTATVDDILPRAED